MVTYIRERVKIPESKIEFDSVLLHSRVSDFMSIPALTLTKDAKMAEAKAIMRDYRISGIPIIDERGHLIGIVSIENIIIALEKNQIDDPIEKHMTTNVVKLVDDMVVSTAMGYLMTTEYGRYPVVNRNNRVVGVVTKADMMQHIYDRLGRIYMHNKRRDEILMPATYQIPDDETSETDHYFSYVIENPDLDSAGQGSTLFKKFLRERDFPSDAARRASISLYEAEVNVVLHAYGKGQIKAYLKESQVLIVIIDKGPGIEDIDLAVKPGYTTASDEVRERGFGAGMGLANIQKYTDKLVILSSNNGVKIEMVIIVKDKINPENYQS